jgi:hypothetical protein
MRVLARIAGLLPGRATSEEQCLGAVSEAFGPTLRSTANDHCRFAWRATLSPVSEQKPGEHHGYRSEACHEPRCADAATEERVV